MNSQGNEANLFYNTKNWKASYTAIWGSVVLQHVCDMKIFKKSSVKWGSNTM